MVVLASRVVAVVAGGAGGAGGAVLELFVDVCCGIWVELVTCGEVFEVVNVVTLELVAGFDVWLLPELLWDVAFEEEGI